MSQNAVDIVDIADLSKVFDRILGYISFIKWQHTNKMLLLLDEVSWLNDHISRGERNTKWSYQELG